VDGRWYGVPARSGGHYGVTAEGYSLEPGESYACKFSFEPYGDLPDGEYRIAFQCTVAPHDGESHWAFADVSIRDGEVR